jgi:hypothetical protein
MRRDGFKKLIGLRRKGRDGLKVKRQERDESVKTSSIMLSGRR